MTTAPTPIATSFQNIINLLKGDVRSVAKPILVTLGTNIQANGDPVNVANQLALAEASLLLSGPTLEKEVAEQAGGAILAFANSLP